MKFSVTTDKLRAALAAVMSAVPAKSALPILGNVLLEAEAKTLKLSTTDLEISITTSIEAKVPKKGTVAIPAKKFAEIIDALPQTDIEIEAQNNRLEMRFGTGDYKIAGMPADEFPRLPEVNQAKEIKIPADILRRMIQKTAYAASNDETRPALNGIFWQTTGDKMKMVTTDGHRLAKIEVDNPMGQGYGDVIVPPRALNLVSRLAVDGITEIGVIFNENSLIFSCGQNTISTRVIEGPYPNYEQVIPKYNNKSLIIGRTMLADTVRRVAILANTLTHQVKFSINKNTLQLSATNVDFGGEAIEKLPCQYDGEDIDIGYNAAYVLDILKQLDSDEVKFALSTAVSAAIVTTLDPTSDYVCLVMPLRLAD
jgi:DNA polymerase III subunit beta